MIRTLLCLLFVTTACSFCRGQQLDTIIDGKRFNTVIIYKNADMKSSSTEDKMVVYGNTKDSVRNGKWYYVYQGTYVVIGKFKDGYKHGRWLYGGTGYYREVTWRKKQKVRDLIRFDNGGYGIIDVDAQNNILRKNGYLYNPPVRFL